MDLQELKLKRYVICKLAVVSVENKALNLLTKESKQDSFFVERR